MKLFINSLNEVTKKLTSDEMQSLGIKTEEKKQETKFKVQIEE